MAAAHHGTKTLRHPLLSKLGKSIVKICGFARDFTNSKSGYQAVRKMLSKIQNSQTRDKSAPVEKLQF
jgi:hypothetical protein